MVDLGEAVAQRKARLQQLQSEIEQVRGELDVLAKALAIIDKNAPIVPAVFPPQQPPQTADVRKRFP